MPDDLRTRIAAALARADQDWCSDRPLYEDMADAVIRELQLRQEWTWTWPRTNEPDTEWGYGLIVDTREEAVIEGDGRSRPLLIRPARRAAHRYVTEWIADE